MAALQELTIDAHQVAGQRVLVTGGTKGIGQALVVRLRESGAVVLTTGRTQPEDLDDAILFIASDVSTALDCEAVTRAVRSRLGASRSWPPARASTTRVHAMSR